jgi:dihydrofolate synthase/folylpolyglutamate synthase
MPAIAGEHQLLNAAAVLQLLRSVSKLNPVTDDSIRKGLETVKLAGRFHFFAGSVPVLVDVAHNPQAAGILADYLRSRFTGQQIHAVFASMRDKDIAGVLAPLKPLVADWYLAPIALARAATEQELLSMFKEMNIAQVHSGFSFAAEAIAQARQQAAPGDLVLVFGTFPLVAEFLALNPQA